LFAIKIIINCIQFGISYASKNLCGYATILGGLTIHPPVANYFLQCICAEHYDCWLAVDKIIAIINRLCSGAACIFSQCFVEPETMKDYKSLQTASTVHTLFVFVLKPGGYAEIYTFTQSPFNISQCTTQLYYIRRYDDDDDDDDDESISYVRPLLQLQTVTSVLMIRSDEQFSFQIATERGWKVAAA